MPLLFFRMEYKVFFEIYGKKLQVAVNAANTEEAKHLVVSAIRFHEVRPVVVDTGKVPEGFDVNEILKFFGGFKK